MLPTPCGTARSSRVASQPLLLQDIHSLQPAPITAGQALSERYHPDTGWSRALLEFAAFGVCWLRQLGAVEASVGVRELVHAFAAASVRQAC